MARSDLWVTTKIGEEERVKKKENSKDSSALIIQWNIHPLPQDQVEGALNMPASYNTVVARAQLAQQFHEHSRDQTRICQQLVHDQHLQQQGKLYVCKYLNVKVFVSVNVCDLVISPFFLWWVTLFMFGFGLKPRKLMVMEPLGTAQ